MRKALDADKSKSYVVEVSPLGLVEMTRQNVTDGVREILTEICPTCHGEGVVLSAETVALDGLRKMREIAVEKSDEAFLIRVNPKVAAALTNGDSGLTELEDDTGKRFHFEGGDANAIETFEVVESGTRAAIEERALPFKVGEEVLVKIDEPHMYNDKDAVARIDSYIVSITGGGPYVGERKLVRIDEVERAAAIASLLGGESPNGHSNGSESANESPNGASDDSQLDSDAPARKRSRGRRGGRGRSRAKQGSTDE
jgi:ribonuclease G